MAENGKVSGWETALLEENPFDLSPIEIRTDEEFGRFMLAHPDKVKSRIRKGIPDALRPTIWPALSGATEARRNNKGVFESLLGKEAPADVMLIIKKDKKRTLQNHSLFRSKNPGDPNLDATRVWASRCSCRF